jgi:hypothetical protein
MTNCLHSEEDIILVDESFWDSKVRCNSCGKTFDVPGWARRGVGKAFFDGFTGGLRSLIGAEIREKKD